MLKSIKTTLAKKAVVMAVAGFVGTIGSVSVDAGEHATVMDWEMQNWVQRGPVGQLGEGHGPVLLGAGKRPDPVIAAIPVDDPRESSPWQEVHELSEQGLAGVHEHLLGETPKSAPSNSNRHHAFSLQTPQKSWLSKPAPLS